MATKTETRVRAILRTGSVHVNGTDYRVIDEAAWQMNVEVFARYTKSLVGPANRRLACVTAIEVREYLVVYPTHEVAPSRDTVIRTARARVLSRFVEAIR